MHTAVRTRVLILAPDPALATASAPALIGATVTRLVDSFLESLPTLVIGIVVFVLGLLLARLVRYGIVRATAKRSRSNLGIVFGRLGYFAVVLLGALAALTIVSPSMTPARLVSLLGIGSVAIGFAFKDIFQNMVAGILLLWREPFRIGDEITVATFTGTVESIETRATYIKTYDGKRVIVPNSVIYTQSVSVITAYELLRSEYDIGIGYGDDVEKAKMILHEIFADTEGVLDDPAPDVLVWELAGSTVNVRARWWSRPERACIVKVRDRVLAQVRERFPAAGIDLPYPTRVVLFHDQTEATDGDRSHQREGWPTAPGAEPPKRGGRHARLA